MLLIKNVTAVDSLNGERRCDILIDQGKIRKMGTVSDRDCAGVSLLNGEHLTAIPGLMDAHVHFRDPGFTWKEDLTTGSRAAAHGGVTGVVCMANTNPVVDNPQVLSSLLERAEDLGIRMYQVSSLTKGLKGKELVDMEAMKEAGAAGFSDDGIPVMDEAVLLEGLRRAAALDLPVSLHEEDPLFINGAGVNDGEAAKKLGYGGANRTAEDVLTARDCMLALHTGAHVVIQHISSKNAVEMVRLAKKLGANIHAEATPHHFTLTEEAVLTYGSNARMNPPLRTEEDRMAIIEGLADGTIDMIVTDHAPHSSEEKNRALPQAPSGIIGLETSLALALHSLVAPGYLSLQDVIRLMSYNPGRVFHKKTGILEEGADADLVLLNTQEIFRADHFMSRSSNSPFLGWELPGRIYCTICRGEIVYDGRQQ